MGIACWFWTRDGECLNAELEDIRRGEAVLDCHGKIHVVPVSDVMPAAIDEWHETNGQFGVGA